MCFIITTDSKAEALGPTADRAHSDQCSSQTLNSKRSTLNLTNICTIFPMTTVLVLARSPRRTRVEGILLWAVLVGLASGLAARAQDRPVHWLNAGAMPPGAIGSLRLERGGPGAGYFQPVRIRAPKGARIALAMESGYSAAASNDVLVGMQVGPVYRLRVSGVPNNENVDIFPTVEVIDRLYPPPGLARRFPIPVELTEDELDLAARGAFVTRVIYAEDPQQSLPVARRADEQPWIEAPPGEDPLVTADRNGRPVAILRIGSRVPSAGQMEAGFNAAPPFVLLNSAECAGAATPARDIRSMKTK